MKNRPKVQKKDIFWAKKRLRTKKQQKSLTMSSDNKEESSEELFFNFIESGTADQARLFGAINKELEAFLAKENNEKDATDGILDFLARMSHSVHGEFDELVSGYSDKRDLLGRSQEYSRYYSTQKLTLRTRTRRVRTKATVRRLPVKTRRLSAWQVNREYGKKRTIYPFKIKQTLPEQKSKHQKEWRNNKNN